MPCTLHHVLDLPAYHEDPDAALLDSDFVPAQSSKMLDLASHAQSKSCAEGEDEGLSDTVRADSSSFKFLAH